MGRRGDGLPEDIALLAQWSKKNFKGGPGGKNPKNIQNHLRETKSFGGEPPKGLIYGGIGVWGASSGGNTLGDEGEAGEASMAAGWLRGRMGKKPQGACFNPT
jgi:hypothetical protein